MSDSRALVLRGPRQPPAVIDRDLPPPAAHEVLVRLEACGICHSDLFVAGLDKLPLAPVALGHEGIGRVVEAGAESGFAPGDRAGITFLASSCGRCELCASGRERFCGRQRNHGYTADGALATHAVVAAQHLVRVPESLDAVTAAPLCCAGWTAYGALREAGLRPGQTVALFGIGGLGHLALQYAARLGLRVVAVDPNPEALELARALGAETAVAPPDAPRCDAAIVFTAAASAIAQAFQSLVRNGTLVLVGLARRQYELPLVDTVLKGITVKGSYLGTREDLARVFELAGEVRPAVQVHALDEAPAVLRQLSEGAVRGRAVVRL